MDFISQYGMTHAAFVFYFCRLKIVNVTGIPLHHSPPLIKILCMVVCAALDAT